MGYVRNEKTLSLTPTSRYTHAMEFDTLLLFLKTHTAVVCFCGAFFGGTSVTLFLATLSGQGLFSPWTLVAFASLGNFCSDVVWYGVGRTPAAGRLLATQRIRQGCDRVNRLMDTHPMRHLTVFVLVKFMYGLRVLAVVYLGSRKYETSRFILYNGLAVVTINAAVVAAGWGAGRGVALFVDLLTDLRTLITALVAAMLLAHLIKIWVARSVSRRRQL